MFGFAILVLDLRHLLGDRRRRGPGGADAADGDPDRRRVDAHRADPDEGGRGRHRLHADPGGLRRWSLPTALPGILTGIILAIARVAGESAPLLFTALFSNFWLSSLFEPTASLSILIYNFSSMPFANQIELAWAASLVLVLIVLVFNILSRLVGRPKV